MGPLSLPTLGTTFNELPTASTTYPTAVYSQEYDLVADFPQYPIDFLSDLNADLGFLYQHFEYADLTPKQISSAIPLPTVGTTTTHYYMIPTANLPLLDPVRLIPVIGNPLADLLQPDLTVLVNLGYGSTTQGWSTGPANVPTPFGLFPTDLTPVSVLTALGKGAVQGVTNAVNDLKTPTLFDLSSLSGYLAALHTIALTPSNTPSLLQLVAAFSTLGNENVPVSATGGVLNTLTNVISNDLAVVRPLADTAVALAVSLPEYDAKLFASQLAAGHLLNAVGMPIAAELAVAPFVFLAGVAFPIIGAIATTLTKLAELVGLEPNPAAATASATRTPHNNAQPVLSTNTGANGANAAHRGGVEYSSATAAASDAGQPISNPAGPHRAPSTVTSSGVHVSAVSAVACGGAAGGSPVTGPSGSGGGPRTIAGTRAHR